MTPDRLTTRVAEVDARRSGWRTIKAVAPYLWPNDRFDLRVRVVFALLALATAKAVTVGTPFIYKAAVDQLAATGGDDPFFLFGLGAVALTIAYGGARVLGVGFDQLRDVIFAKVGQRALRLLALTTFRHIHKLSLRYHITRKTGGLSRIIDRGVKGLEFLLRFMLFSVGPLILELCLIATILLVVLDFRYFAIITGIIVAYVWFTFKVTEWRVQIRREMNDQDTEANQKAVDSLLNYETVKYFNAEDRESDRYETSMRGYEQAALRTSYSLAALNLGQAILIASGTVGVMVLAAYGVLNGDLTVGDFVLVNAYMIQITVPLNFLGTVYREIRQSLIDMGDMFDLLEVGLDIVDRPDAVPLEVTGGRIEFDKVDFGYDPQRPILKSVDLCIEPGQMVAIVGPSGSGKSTIGRLLFRFYDVTGGALRIDGQDVRDVRQGSLHSQIGIVPQDTVLFNETIEYNIAYGLPHAREDDVVAAAKAAQLHDFIMDLPEGYQTQVGERGLKLSGGEKQRVGISRTLLKNPPILLLDEATSALDSETEKEIQASFQKISEGRTVIAIAHRLSTIVESDLIVVLEDGRIIERGRHEELLNAHGRYAAMWHRQQAEDAELQAA
ncbi:MAG: ABC transporter ATP-binding protein/permease [Rhodobacteraceae bacterium]|nr:ABC transporter ATP-binding protein/permease [Paracoccaceae bacterium]MCY4196378.1 ABC transporter ATP-binding protein/permease [Paracoccaceae bacterium]